MCFDPTRPVAPDTDRSSPSGIATGGFVCAVVGLILACVPVAGLVGVPILVVGLVLSGVALSRRNRTHHGLALAGLILALVGLPNVAVVNAITFAGPTATPIASADGPVTTPAPSSAPRTYTPPTHDSDSGEGYSIADEAFLDVLDDRGVERGTDAETISLGHSVCSYLAGGGTPNGSDQVLSDAGADPYDAAVITGASIGAYCPSAG